MSKIKIVVAIISVFLILGIILLIVTAFNKNQEEPEISLENSTDDIEVLAKISEEFVEKYFNYDSSTLRSGEWKDNINPYIDNEAVERYDNNELYKKLYDREWQLSHIVNDETSSELMEIEYIEANYSNGDVSMNVSVTLEINGVDDVKSPYFEMIQTQQKNCTIDFTSANKIYSVNCDYSSILDTGSDYNNT